MPSWTPNRYGATARGHSACVGYETWYCARRSTADRIRKVIAAHDAAGGWCGPATLDALVDYAVKPEMRRYPVAAVVEMFAMRGQLLAQAGILMPARHGCRLPTTMTYPDPLPHPGTKPAPDAVTVALDRAKQVVDFFALSIDDREPLEMAAAEATGGNMTAFEGRVENLRETLDAARAKVQ